jgi:hypothetical protein
VILLLAGRDTAGTMRRLLRSGDHERVRVLPPAGLSAPGWAHDPERPDRDRLVIDGRVRRPDQLTGVITALDAVLPGDLPHVTAADRGFVAAEMTGFLRDWLATLCCPVIDRPTTLALSGRSADRAAWWRAAATLGIPERLGASVPVTRVTTVTVAAGRIVSPPPGRMAAAAVALARAAAVTAARLMFADEPGDPVLVGARPWWHVPSPLTLHALLTHVGER